MKDNAEMSLPRIRVAAYVVRQRAVPELLVFDHVGMPEAGTQVPAGGVKVGEALDEAVLREVAEESGLLTARLIKQIAVEDKPHPDTGQPRRTSFFYLQASNDTPDAWAHDVHGDGDDAGLTFGCRFLPLPLKRPLADDQDVWLDRIDSRWLTASRNLQ
ncbi:NUDIX domain-containing protein [Streptomyces globisporus]|uniref:NUDIX hydrolase n=1 Tax=Streptomyces globisporus TaxID=1908 RepID=UPI0036373761